MLEINKIYNKDCHEMIPQLEDDSIDLLIADPPYNISKKNNFNSMYRYNKYRGCDFGEWDKDFSQTNYLELLKPKMKKDCNLVIFNSYQNLTMISSKLEELGFSVKRPLILKKKNPLPANRDRMFMNSFEFGLWAVHGKWTFNRDAKYHELFWEYAVGKGNHVNEKPVEFLEYLIKILSNEGDLILDPTIGSGSTALACINTKRNFIGFEWNEFEPEKYYDVAIKRINERKE